MKSPLKWFNKQNRPIPENATCRNCGALMTGRYCQDCGQDIFSGAGIPILKLIGQMLDNAFALDGKTPKTLAYLLIRPGFLSSEFMNGRINRYVNPVKLFWMSTLIFFAILISQFNTKTENLFNYQSSSTKNADELPLDTASQKVDTVNIANNLFEQEVEEKINITIGGDQTDAEKLKQLLPDIFALFKNYFTKFAPYIAFLLIPFFALFLALFFWRNKYYYIHHLIFTIHFHSFLWIYSSLLLIVNMLVSAQYPGWLDLLLFLIPGIYLVFALHRFYHFQCKNNLKTWWNSTWKAITISFFYLILISIVFLYLIRIVLKHKYPELFIISEGL